MPFADIIADAVAGTPRQQEMWLFLNAVPTKAGFRKWAPHYELLSVGLVIVLLVEDMVLSVKSVGNVVDKWPAKKWFGNFAYVIFTTEYVSRVWACMASKALNNGSCRAATLGRLKFGVSGLLLVDFVVLGAFYLQLYVDTMYSAADSSKLQGLQVLRMFRAFRAFRSAKMLKMDRKANALGVLLKVLHEESTPIMATLTIAFMLVIILATLMYYMENTAQPDDFSSIPAAMWWSVTALTSVGYGDVVPITILGKCLGCFACVVGAGIIALPTGILSNGFNEEIRAGQEASEAAEIEGKAIVCQQQFDKLSEELTGLHSVVDGVDSSQQQLLRALQRMWPEKVLEILGAEDDEEIRLMEAFDRVITPETGDVLRLNTGEETGVRPGPSSAPAVGSEQTLPAPSQASTGPSKMTEIRDKVERDVAALKKNRKQPRTLFTRPGMQVHIGKSSAAERRSF